MGATAIEEVRWLKPVRPGDRLTLRATVLDTRTSKSRPDLGFIGTLMELHNQSGECVMTLNSGADDGPARPGAAA